ncbi:protein phosphatase [Nocardioides sp. Soil777]|uniref:PP2C family protein-serine/threonine phosphatase n=1 Tax=Nocardioides sp. Soil777 TaxID=1736409 RepID=UPI0007032CFA|nr:protein phosphatase 2C domain-containing protein [Nocardioides sp. Soil777]KRF02762.1 protein phosphatase [Nocardioides sp. Soil777]
MKPVDLHHGAATDVGHVRTVNEDSFLVAPPVFVVADGMGGHAGGDVASRIVVEEFARLVEQGYDPGRGAEQVADTIARSQARIVEYGDGQRADHPRWHAGTTAVVAVLVDDGGTTKWLLANLGDSRIYRFTDGRLDQVSVDHSVVQELIDAGTITVEEASVHPERHVITRALGSPEGVRPDFFLLPLPAVERLLLCSDGISGMITDADIAAILDSVPDPRDAADALVRAALDAGGRDNATAVVVDVVGLVHDDSYDSERQLASLEDKLGARP